MAIEFYDSLNVDSNDDSYFLGELGVGTTSPGAKLDVVGDVRASEGSDYTSLSTSGGDTIFSNVSSGSNNIRIFNGGSERMRITSSGSVGIGITNPGAKLDVDGDVLIKSGEYISWGTAGATSIEGSTASNKLQFRTNGADRMIIDSSGNVGVATTSPTEKLTVSGGANVTGKFAVGSSATHPSFDFYNQGTAYFNGAVTVDDTLDLVNLKVSGTQGTDGQVLTSTGAGVAWEDVSGGSSPWTTDTNGITYTAGGVGIGGASVSGFDLRVYGLSRFNSDVRFDGNVSCAGGDLELSNSLKDVNSATGTSGQVLSSEGAGGGVEWIDAGVKSTTTGEPSGSDSVINIVSLTQAEYDAGTPVATTLYIIT